MASYIQVLGQDGIKLFPDAATPLRLSIKGIDPLNPGEVFGDLSDTFNVPASEEVNQFFNSAFDNGGQLITGTDRSVPCAVNNSERTLFYADLELTQWSEDTNNYICRIKSGISSLSDALGDKLLSESKIWDQYDHIYSMDNVIANQLSTDNVGFDYPLVDLGDDGSRLPYDEATSRAISTSFFGAVSRNPDGVASTPGYNTDPRTPMRVDQWKPAIRANVVLDAIFDLAGKTYTTQNLAAGIEDMIILPSATDKLGIQLADGVAGELGFGSAITGSLEGGAFNITNLNSFGTAGSSSYDRTEWAWGGSRNNTLANAPVNQELRAGSLQTRTVDGLNAQFYILPENGSYSFNFSGTIEQTGDDLSNVGNNDFVLCVPAIIRNSTAIAKGENQRFTRGFRGTWDFSVSAEYTGSKGDTITAGIVSIGRRGGSSRFVRAEISDLSFGTALEPSIWEGKTVKLGLQFGEEAGVDLLDGMQKKLNLIAAPNRLEQDDFEVEQFFDWINNGPRLDWSNRGVEEWQEFPVLQDASNKYIFADAEDDDRHSKYAEEVGPKRAYGSSEIVIDTDISSGEAEIGDYFGSLATSTPGRNGDDTKATDGDYRNGIPHLYEWDSPKAETMQFSPRIGFIRTIPVDPFYYGDDNTSSARWPSPDAETISNVNQMNTVDINFSSSTDFQFASGLPDAYSIYWKQWIEHITNPTTRRIEARFRFDPEDLIDIPLNATVHYKGSNYLIVEMDGFNVSEPDFADVVLLSYDDSFKAVFGEITPRFVEVIDPSHRTIVIGMTTLALNTQMEVIDGAFTILGDDFLQLTAEPGTIETFDVQIRSNEDLFTGSAGDFVLSTGAPGVSLGGFTTVGDITTVAVTITVQDDNLFDDIVFTNNLSPFDGVTVNFDFFLADGTTRVAPLVNPPSLEATEGVPFQVQVFLEPESGFTFRNVNETWVSDAGNVPGITQSARNPLFEGLQYIFTVVPTNVDGQTYRVELSGDAPTLLPEGEVANRLTINFTEDTTTNIALSRSVLSFDAIANRRYEFDYFIYPLAGHELQSASAMEVAPGANWIQMQTSIISTGFANIPFEVVGPSAADSVSISIDGNATPFGAQLDALEITLIDAIDGAFLSQAGSFRRVGIAGQQAEGEINVEITPGPSRTITIEQINDTITGPDMGSIEVIETQLEGSAHLTIPYTVPVGGGGVILTLDGTAGFEQFGIQFEINGTDVDFGGLDTITQAIGYTMEQFSDPFTTNDAFEIRVSSSDVMKRFASQNDVVATVQSPYTAQTRLVGNDIIIDISGSYPSTGFELDDPARIVPITLTGAPSGIAPATIGAFGAASLETPADGSQNASVGSMANGATQVSGTDPTGWTSNYTGGGQLIGKLIVNPSSGGQIGTYNLHPLGNTSIVLDTITIYQIGIAGQVALTIDTDRSGLEANSSVQPLQHVVVGFPNDRSSVDFVVEPTTGYTVAEAGVSNVGSLPSINSAPSSGMGTKTIIVNYTIPSTSNTESLTLTSTVELEPYLLTVELSETIVDAVLTQSSFSTRFQATDIGVYQSLGVVALKPTVGSSGFAGISDVNLPTAGDVRLTYRDTEPINGIVFINVEGRPNQVGPNTFSATIGVATAPAIRQATVGAFGMLRFEAVFGTELTIQSSITANGQWKAVSTGNIASVGVDGFEIASSQTELVGTLAITIPDDTPIGTYPTVRLEDFSGTTAISSILVEVVAAAEAGTGEGASVAQEWTLIPSYSGGLDTAEWTWTDAGGTARTTILQAPQEDETIEAVGRPVQTVGTGGREIPGDIVGNITGDAGSVGGMTFNFVAQGMTPATVPANQIYFEYQ